MHDLQIYPRIHQEFMTRKYIELTVCSNYIVCSFLTYIYESIHLVVLLYSIH
jgi:hypothetical protein